MYQLEFREIMEINKNVEISASTNL